MEPLETKPEPETSAHAETKPPEERQSATAAPSAARKKTDGAWETVRSLLVVLLGVFCFRTFIAEATVIPTGSMEKTILIGDHIFLNKLPYGPRLPYTSWRLPRFKSVQRQEIVAFRYPRNPSMMFVKRVIAVGGDVVRIESKKAFVNGQPLDEPYVQFQSSTILPLRDNFPPSVSQIATLPAAWGLDPAWARDMPSLIRVDGLYVPPGYLFVMGDNRDNSMDSRFWGFVPESHVVGEPLFVYWSFDAPSKDWTPADLKARLKFDLSIIRDFFHRTRWSRTGKSF